MFGKNKQKQENIPASETPVVNHDMIVHNMPSPARLSGNLSGSSKPADSGFGLPTPQKQNFKAVGLVIIGGGIIIIGALVYLSYRFIISPTAGKNTAANQQPVASEQKKATTTAPEITPAFVSTTTPVIVATSTPLEVATSTSATSSISGELSGQGGIEFPPVLDSDNDGLFDDEEVLLGTSPSSADSDGDKYSDSAELEKGYDPAGSGKLISNTNLAEYKNKTFNYSIIYPKSWEAKSLADDTTIIFMSPDDSLIQISVQDNPDKAGILGWYESSFPGMTATYDQLKNKDGWDGIMGADNLNFYLTDSKHENIYVISYIPVIAERLVYPNIFKLMIDSLVIK